MYKNPILEKDYSVGGTVTKRCYVKYSADATVVLAAAASDLVVGVAQNDADTTTSGKNSCRVMLLGISEVIVGSGNATRGKMQVSDASGYTTDITTHVHTENTAGSYAQNATTGSATIVRAAGMALISGVSGDIIPVFVCPSLG